GLTGLAGCGGVLRNCHGGFLAAFAAKVGSDSVVHAELWGIINALELAKNKGLERIRVDSDSMIAINLIRNGCNKEHPPFHLVQSPNEWR
ncbi:ribonuclease H, partial [Trifolium pratense]